MPLEDYLDHNDPVPSTPEATPPQTPEAPKPDATKTEDPVTKGLLSNILKLRGAQKPPEEAKPAEEKPAAPKTESAATKTETTEPPATPKEEPAEKKVTLRKKAPAPDIAKEVSRGVAEALRAAQPAAKPTVEAPAAPVPPPSDEFTESEREELALAEYAEAADPSKKGLASKFKAFYKAHAKFLEDRQAEDPDYDPSEDPTYREFCKKNEPQFSRVERQKFLRAKTVEEAKTLARQEVERDVKPKFDEVERKLREVTELPKINSDVTAFVDELSQEYPEDIRKFFAETKDMKRTMEAFPGETEILTNVSGGAATIAKEVLSLRRGITTFSDQNPKHKYIAEFIDSKAREFIGSQSEQLRRDGKEFIHPYLYNPADTTRWTFEDGDILALLKAEAAKQAKDQIAAHRARIEAGIKARELRTVQTSTPPPAPDTVKASPKSPVSEPMPGNAKPGAPVPSTLASVLKLGRAGR